jgi:glycosyltransferase involved in cell wall biosynthesis
MVRQKGYDVLLRALRGLGGVETRIVGDGPLLAAHRACGRELDVRFLGALPPAEVEREMRSSEVFVLASRFEGFPNALLEAMAHGLAVVATRVGSVPEIVRDGVQGLLVPPEDPAALRAAIARVAGDAGLRERLGRAARERARDFSWDRIAAEIERILAEVAGGRAGDARGAAGR